MLQNCKWKMEAPKTKLAQYRCAEECDMTPEITSNAVPQDSHPAVRHSEGGRGQDDSDGGAHGDGGRHHQVGG